MKRKVMGRPRNIVLMALLVLVLVAVFVYALPKHNTSVVSQPVAQKKSNNLIFDDEFNGTKLDSSKWVTCYDNYSAQYDGCTNYGNWEKEWYKSSQVSEADGSLILTAQKQKTIGSNQQGAAQSYDYVSGMVTTAALNKNPDRKLHWDNEYGYYQARILVPTGQAVWPAFWMLPSAGGWPPEIDIMEVLGNKPNQLLNTYFWDTADNQVAKDSSSYDNGDSLGDNYHVYSVDWQPTYINWYLDGKLVKHVTGANVTKQKMYMVLDLAVGGTLPGYPDKTTPTTTEMLVDYVRVYKHKE